AGGANALIPTSSPQKNIATYQQILTNAKITAKNYSNLAAFPNSQSSACLLMAISMNRGGAAFLNPDTLGSSVTDSDGDGVKEIVDGWGTPLFFFRFPTPSNWPTGNLLQNPNTSATATYLDPLDPFGTLANS